MGNGAYYGLIPSPYLDPSLLQEAGTKYFFLSSIISGNVDYGSH